MKANCYRVLLAAGLIALAVSLAPGCGEGDSSETGSSQAGTADSEGIVTAEVPDSLDAPANAEEPRSIDDAARLPVLARATQDDSLPAIRGSDGKSIRQWLAFVVKDSANFWAKSFHEGGLTFKTVTYAIYPQAKIATRCGSAGQGIGPFYCSADRTIYLPLLFFESGFLYEKTDASLAIPVAHEMGHHVLQLLKFQRTKGFDIEQAADCLAGIWARSLLDRDLFEKGDLEEAVANRAVVGDPDGTDQTRPEAHGTKQQRIDAFLKGFNSGEAAVCVTAFTSGG